MSCADLALIAILARAAHADDDPRARTRENPFACLGGYEALSSGGRTIAEMRGELQSLLGRMRDEPVRGADIDRAADLCVAGRLKARLGDGDAATYLERAIAAAPDEPGYELWAGTYWATMRGARRPQLERAERHFYAGLRKLAHLRARGQALSFHDTVEDWIEKRLLVLYQHDGLPLLPWKAHRHAASGLWAPGLAFSTQLRAGKDTRDFFYNSEMRQFTGEANFAASDLRAGAAFDARERWDLARAPLRLESNNRLRLRHNWLGAVDASYRYSFSPQSQVRNHYDPNAALSDVTVVELGAGLDRSISIYPLFDLRLFGHYRHGRRQGTVEFEPERVETFRTIEARPSLARFFGPDVVTLDLVYVRIDLDARPGGVLDDRLRQREIRAARLQWAIHSPLLLPGSGADGMGWARSNTRGLHLYGGAVDDREAWGRHTVVNRDAYGGLRFAGVGRFGFTLQGTWRLSYTQASNPNFAPPLTVSSPGQQQHTGRGSVIAQVALIDEEAIPGLPARALGLGLDMLNLVVPVHVDRAFSGRDDYENVRAGAELWAKVFATGLGGAAVLVTVGYDFQYFHRLGKGLHLGNAALRLGWGEL